MKKIALSLMVVAASGAYAASQAGTQPGDDILGAMAADPLATGALPPDTSLAEAPAAPTAAPTAAPRKIARMPAPAPAASTAPKADLEARAAPEPPPLPAPSPAPVSVAMIPPPVEPQPELPPPPPPAIVDNIPTPRPRPIHAYVPPAEVPRATPAVIRVSAGGAYADGAWTGPVVDAYYGLIQIQAIVQGGRLTGIKVLQYPSDRRTSVFINRQALPILRDEVVRAQSARVDLVSGATLTSRAFVRSLGGALQQAGSGGA